PVRDALRVHHRLVHGPVFGSRADLRNKHSGSASEHFPFERCASSLRRVQVLLYEASHNAYPRHGSGALHWHTRGRAYRGHSRSRDRSNARHLNNNIEIGINARLETERHSLSGSGHEVACFGSHSSAGRLHPEAFVFGLAPAADAADLFSRLRRRLSWSRIHTGRYHRGREDGHSKRADEVLSFSEDSAGYRSALNRSSLSRS